MVQAFDALDGDGSPTNSSEAVHASMLGEVMDFVSEHKTLSTIAGIGVAAGAVYLARAPIGRFLSRCGGSLFSSADDSLRIASKAEAHLGRHIASGVAVADDIAAGQIKLEAGVVGAVKGQPTILRAAGDDAIVSGAQAEAAGAKTSGATGRPLLDALDEAVQTGKVKTVPEPWVYNTDTRGMLKNLPKGGEIKPAAEPVEKLGTVGSTHSPDPADIQKIGFTGLARTSIDVNKHRWLRNKP